MIKASFQLEKERIVRFQVEGHSGLAALGQDILCAAVTSAVRLVESTLNDVLGLEAHVRVQPEQALIAIRLPNKLNEAMDTICQALLTGLMVYLTELHEEYPEHIIVMEV